MKYDIDIQPNTLGSDRTSDKKLSIIIPVFNVEKYIGRCLDSVLKQDVNCCEIILVNDGSTDASEAVCRRYANKYDNIKLINKENGGLASARNIGMVYATGEFVSFLDSDDWMSDDAYSQILEIIDKYSPDVIGFGCQRATDSGVYQIRYQKWNEGIYSTGNGIKMIKEDIINDKELFKFGVIRSSCMHIFKRKLLEKNGLTFLSERKVLNEDYIFVASAVIASNSYYCCKECFYYYFTRENSLTTSYINNMLEKKKILLLEYLKLEERFSISFEQKYRISLLHVNNCYECLANECSSSRANFKKMKDILADDSLKNCIHSVRKEEQSIKAKIFITLMRIENASLYWTAYKLFGIIKRLRLLLNRGKIDIRE